MLRSRISSHENCNFSLQQSLTAFGGAPFTQGSLSHYHAFGLLDKPKFFPCPSIPTAPLALPPVIDARQALGSPDRRAGAKRLRGLTALIPSTDFPQNHRTDATYNLFIELLHRFLIRYCSSVRTVCTIPLPLPSGGTSPGGRGKSCVRTSNSHIN